jgi:hypothetical protein
MARKNDITLRDIESRDERYWFSIIKQLSEGVGFGTLSVSFTIKNGEVTNIQNTEVRKNFNIKC